MVQSKKREKQMQHAKRRARQRFGLSTEAIAKLTLDIQEQKCILLEKQTAIKTAWYAVIEEIELVAIYDSRRHVVVTVIPYRWWKENHVIPKELHKEFFIESIGQDVVG